MMSIRKANERGHANHGWLDTHHSFSFATYHDPAHMGFRALRVLNDDTIVGGGGFPFHGHADMEIISYVTEGALEHKDSMGNGSVIRPGDVQLMSAGTGLQHSEFNHLSDASTHFYQIWIVPQEEGLTPSYAERHFEDTELSDQLRLIVSPDERDGSLVIRQDVALYAGRLQAGTEITHAVLPDRHVWLQVLSGEVTLNGDSLYEGDGAAVSQEERYHLNALMASEVLLFDLA